MEVFSKKLTYTDVDNPLLVPVSSLWASLFPEGSYRLDIPVKDDTTGLVWTFRLFLLKFGSVLILSQLLSGDWLDFVRHKGLEMGDKVTLYCETTQYKITVQRRISTSSGKYMRVDVEADSMEAQQERESTEADAGDGTNDGQYQSELLSTLDGNDDPFHGSSTGENTDTHPDVELCLRLLPETELVIDIQEDNFSHGTQHSGNGSSQRVMMEWIFVITNLIVELPSAVFDQLSSVDKPNYALIAMLISFVAMLVYIVELNYRARKERVTWRWRGRIPWFYYPSPSDMRFGTFADIIGLSCAIPQFIVTTINYSFLHRSTNNPIKLSVWPIIFAFGLLCSKCLENPNRRTLLERQDP